MSAVVIIEPDAQRRMGITQLLEKEEPSFEIEGLDYTCLFDETPSSQPVELAVLGVHSYEDVFELTHAAQRVFSPKRMVMVSGTRSVPHSLARLRPLLAGYVHQEAAPELLMASIRLVLAGGECFPLSSTTTASPPPNSLASLQKPVMQAVEKSPSPAAKELAPTPLTSLPPPMGRSSRAATRNTDALTGAAAEAQMLRLTPRQYEVLVLLARGYPIKTVSRHLNISVSTAKAHTETLYQRLDVSNRSEAVYAAFARGATLGWDQAELANNALVAKGSASVA